MRAVLVALLVAGSLHAAEASSHCHEVSRVLGHRHCGGFGSRWATAFHDGIQFGPLTLVGDRFTESPQVFAGPAGSALARATYAGNRTTTLYGYDHNVTWHGRWLTLGAHMVFEGGSGARLLTTVGASAVQNTPTAFAFVPQLSGGIHHRLGPLDAGVDVSLGVRLYSAVAEIPAAYAGCGRTGCSNIDASTSALVIVPRARVDVWLTRYLTVGVSYGHAVVGSGDIVALHVLGHFTAYDGY